MIRLHALFCDHAVLQREQPIPVWGWADKAGTRVTVRLANRTAETGAGPDGRFMLRLPPMAAGGPYELQVDGDDGTMCRALDVMVGEVWVCSGQSNMEWPVALSANGAAEVAAADHPDIRLFSVPR